MISEITDQSFIPTARGGSIVYTTKSGDTLMGVAAKHYMLAGEGSISPVAGIDLIVSMNPSSNLTKVNAQKSIPPGTTLIIPNVSRDVYASYAGTDGVNQAVSGQVVDTEAMIQKGLDSVTKFFDNGN